MKQTLRIDGKDVNVSGNLVDRVVNYFNPVKGAQRLRARMFEALSGSYIGGSTSRRQTTRWNPLEVDADSNTIYDLSIMRARCRDLVRNTPLATGAVSTTVTNVIGSGLTLQAQLDREILDMTDEQSDAWESIAMREWRLFWETKDVDLTRGLAGPELAELAFRSVLENGDCFALLPRRKRPGSTYSLKVQLVEADRVCNKDNRQNTEKLVQGVEKDEDGAPVQYHIMNRHPNSSIAYTSKAGWTIVPAYSPRTGLRNVLHLCRPLRVGQTRGVPFLAPVIEPLRQIDRYTEAELMAAVISAMFTVFVKTESGDADLSPMAPTSETGGSTTDEDYKMGVGAILHLARNEDISTANPGRPNSSFDPFFLAIVRQIGIALEIPYEVLIKHFTASYSASRAALLEAWKFFLCRRTWFVNNFMQPLYEIFLYEAVAMGRIAAPGFFADPLVRLAYCGAQWIGPSPGQVDPVKEVVAAEKRLDLLLTTHAQETAALTGGDFERNVKQRQKEQKLIDGAGLAKKEKPAAPPAAPPAKDQTDEKGDEDLETD